MTPEATVDIAGFEAAMTGISRDTGIEMEAIMRDNMVLTLADIIKSTPPIDLGDARRGSDASAYKLGKGAVASDIQSIVYGVKRWNGSLLGHTKNIAAGLQMVKSPTGAVFVVADEMVDEAGSKLFDYHQYQRNSKSGRVTRAAKNSATNGMHGNFKKINRLITPAQNLKKYVTMMQGHIGQTRAGWMAAWNHFKSGALTSMYQPPAWVTKHGSGHGSFTDTGTTSHITGEWTATNSIPWISNTVIARLVSSVMRTRMADFARGKYEMRLQRMLDKYKSGPVQA